jgi:hypothetical protein
VHRSTACRSSRSGHETGLGLSILIENRPGFLFHTAEVSWRALCSGGVRSNE